VSDRPTDHRSLWGLLSRLSLSSAVGLGLFGVVLGVALIGPLFAPYAPSALPGIPYQPAGDGFLLGTDFLGRDVLSRVLWGGRSVITLATVATVLGYVVGATIGLVSGYLRGLADSVLMRAMDLILAFPAILFLLIIATGAGANVAALVAGIAVIHVPQIARVIRAATLDVSLRAYVEAAVARGERMGAIVFREILPNIAGTVAADLGPRLTVSVLLVAGMNFLGLGLRPPAADWALMISENRPGLTIQPWAVVVPASFVAALTIAVNVIADGVARSLGTSVEKKLVRR
jgi:peptide/nickel transport system permease protein